MKGQILGFDGETGAISGEDGTRYSFTKVDWKGDRAPQGRDAVDFVGADGVAQEVYLVQSALGASLGSLGSSAREKLVAGSASPGAANARTFVAERPQVVLEGVVLISALLLTFVGGALQTGSSGVSAVGFPGVMNQAVGQLGQMAGTFGILTGNAKAVAPSTGALQFAAFLSYLLWLIPLIAGFAIFRDATGKRMRVLELALGGLCIFSYAIYYLNIQALGALMGPIGGFVTNAVSFGFGGYVLVLCGILLLLTGTGRIKQTPGM